MYIPISNFSTIFFLISFVLSSLTVKAQLTINEGCNKNYLSLLDEDYDAKDWIELFNPSMSPINLNGYFLTDNLSDLNKWAFSDHILAPNSYLKVYCSKKNRLKSNPFVSVKNEVNLTPTTGWNAHQFSVPFVWDGNSNLIINVCSYNSTQYTQNSVFRQSSTSYPSTNVSFVDNSDASCFSANGQTYFQRPNIKLNDAIIGTGTILNGTDSYPAPYGNWYWSARHQILIRKSELVAAGLTAGPINSLAFQVESTTGEFYHQFDISVLPTTLNELNSEFLPLTGFNYHTNFTIPSKGGKVYLTNIQGEIVSELFVKSPSTDISISRVPDNSTSIKWTPPTPNSSNNSANSFIDSLTTPRFNKNSGIYSQSFYLKVIHNSSIPSKIVYATEGNIPTVNSPQFPDSILISSNRVITIKAFPLNGATQILPSESNAATFLFNVDHTTPILLVSTANANLYGTNGIFDNPFTDWVKPAQMTLLSEEQGHPQFFTSRSAIRMDGGAGGSRSQPQRSFRLSMDHSALGERSLDYAMLPFKSKRDKFSDFYLRNGSNQYLKLPYKDACQVYMLSQGTNNYFSGFRPVSVYINGNYHGLYEMREKFNTEFFNEYDGANPDSTEILSLSYYYNLVLRALEGKTENFFNSYNQFLALSPNQADFMEKADIHFDMKHYADYIIAESWVGNTDWPHNNIKIYRSDKSNQRWRFALIDMELSLQPNGWTNCTDNHIRYMFERDPNIPYINIWLRSIQNQKFKNYFINRFMDLMNTSYATDTLLAIEQQFFNLVSPEMPVYFQRWGQGNVSQEMQQFVENHAVFREQIACRNNNVKNHLKNEFGLTKRITLQLDAEPIGKGTIEINSIHPTNYPWSGEYFDGVPIQLRPQAIAGWEFSHWKPNIAISDTLTSIFDGNVSTNNLKFTAVFKRQRNFVEGEIVINLYPNPVKDLLTISYDNFELAENVNYSIYDLNGKILKSGSLIKDELSATCFVGDLDAAIYLIRFQSEDRIFETKRFLKIN